MSQPFRNTTNGLFQSLLFGLIITFVFGLIWESPLKKIKVEINPFAEGFYEETLWFVDDFDGDGNSERIRIFHGVNSVSMDMIHYDPEGNITAHQKLGVDEWPPQLRPEIIDIDHDNKKELIFFTTRNDSVFLNLYSLTSFEMIGKPLYFDTFERKRDVYACSSYFSELADLDNNGSDELFFSFDAGYGLRPRGIFRIDFPDMKISGSNTGYMNIGISDFVDLDGDKKPEILVNTVAPNNTWNSDLAPFPDTLSYLLILDYELGFFLPPIPFPGVYSSMKTLVDPRDSDIFYASYNCRTNSKEPLKVMTFNREGKILNEKSWKNMENPESLHTGLHVINGIPYTVIYNVGRFELNPSLSKLPQKLEKRKNNIVRQPTLYDLDRDGSEELILANEKDEVIIYNEKQDYENSFVAPIKLQGQVKIFEKLKAGNLHTYVMTSLGGFFEFTYRRNHLFFLNYLVYFLVFAGSSSVLCFLLVNQRRRMERTWETEKQLSELQFNSVKNQLNPHFLFNALNSVAFMIREGEKEEAYDFLAINARMIQRMMNDAKEVKRPLRDELQFTRDFVEIQRHRFKNRFSSSFEIDPEVDQNLEVPKMCIHTYVENAIKHGFRHVHSGGELTVTVSHLRQGVQIEITDNGSGRSAAAGNHEPPGMGVKMMKELYRLFEKYYGYRIDCSMTDPKSGSGTCVLLAIRKGVPQA